MNGTSSASSGNFSFNYIPYCATTSTGKEPGNDSATGEQYTDDEETCLGTSFPIERGGTYPIYLKSRLQPIIESPDPDPQSGSKIVIGLTSVMPATTQPATPAVSILSGLTTQIRSQSDSPLAARHATREVLSGLKVIQSLLLLINEESNHKSQCADPDPVSRVRKRELEAHSQRALSDIEGLLAIADTTTSTFLDLDTYEEILSDLNALKIELHDLRDFKKVVDAISTFQTSFAPQGSLGDRPEPTQPPTNIRKSAFIRAIVRRFSEYVFLENCLGGDKVITNLLEFLHGTREDFLTISQLEKIKKELAFFESRINSCKTISDHDKAQGHAFIQGILKKFDAGFSLFKPKDQLLENLANLQHLLKGIDDGWDCHSIASNLLISISNTESIIDNVALAGVSIFLEKISFIVNRNQENIGAEKLELVERAIAKSQHLCAPAWAISTSIATQPLNAARAKKFNALIGSFRDMCVCTSNLDRDDIDTHVFESLTSIILLRDKPDWQIGELAKNNLTQLVLKLLEAKDDDVQFGFLSDRAKTLQVDFDNLLSPLPVPDNPSSPDHVKKLNRMLSSILPVLADTDEGAHGDKIVSRLIASLQASTTVSGKQFAKVDSELEKLTYNLDKDRYAGNISLDLVRANVSYLRKLCVNLSAEVPKETEPGELKSKWGFLANLKSLRPLFNDLDPGFHKALSSVQKKLISVDGEPSITEWATISLELEDLGKEISAAQKKMFAFTTPANNTDKAQAAKMLARIENIAPKLAYLKTAISYLEFIARFAWTEQAKKSASELLEPHFAQFWFDPGYSSFTTNELTVGVSVGIPDVPVVGGINVSGGIGVSGKDGVVNDDEGYIGELGLTAVSGSAAADVVVAKAGAKVSHGRGDYTECKSHRHYISTKFDDIIERYSRPINKGVRSARAIAPLHPSITDCPPIDIRKYFNRTTTVNVHGIVHGNELLGFEALQKKYNDQHERMAQFFSILQSRNSARSILPANADPIVGVAKSEVEPYGPPLKAKASTTSVMFSVGAGLNELGAAASYPAGDAGVAPSLNAEYIPYQKLTLEIDNYSSICRSFGEFSGERNAIDKREIQNKSMGLINRMLEPGNDKIEAGLWAKNNFARIEALVQEGATINENDIAYRGDLDRDAVGFAEGDVTLKAYVNYCRAVKTNYRNAETARAIAITHEKYRMLKQDFECYTQLQCQLKYGDRSTKPAIDAFHEKYGAHNSRKGLFRENNDVREDCMARMLMLTACLYTDLIDLEEAADGAAQLTELRTNLIELEKSILDPDFPFDRQVVEKRISYKESFKLQTVEQRFTISLKGQMTFASSKITALMANTTLSVMHRKRYHPNIFRDGDFIDLTIRIGGLLEQDAFSTLLQQTAHGLRNDPRTCDAAQGFADSLSDIQDSYAALAASPLDGGKGYDLTFRFYKPSKINTGWALSQTTFTAINNLTIAAKGSIPVAPAISVTVGASHDRATTSTVFIRFSPENILPWATRYVHELAAKNVVNDDGNFAAANYWDQHIKKEQRSGIEKLFKNVARELALVRSGENLPVGGLLEQMKEIATLFARDSAFDKYALETRTENFIIAAEAYTNSTRLTEEATYHDAIKKLEELFFEYHPHIQRHKAEYQRTPKELQLQTT